MRYIWQNDSMKPRPQHKLRIARAILMAPVSAREVIRRRLQARLCPRGARQALVQD